MTFAVTSNLQLMHTYTRFYHEKVLGPTLSSQVLPLLERTWDAVT